MARSVKLPYYATDIPSPLPTDAEIESASLTFLPNGGKEIVEIGQHFVVKFGRAVNLIEGENMLFVRETTNIPVPRVYALYSNPQNRKNYIIMERVVGKTLSSLWPDLTASEKESIVAKLHGYFSELRQLPSPGYYGSLGRRHLLDPIFWTIEAIPIINGPFTSEDALNEAMAQKSIFSDKPYRAEFYRQCLPRLFCGHNPTFTHGSCQPNNIMVQRDLENTQSPNNSNFKVVITNWEESGWYPSYWEYGRAFWALRGDDDWDLYLEKILDPCVFEAAWLLKLRMELAY
jgi:phosphotransferase family enzyme